MVFSFETFKKVKELLEKAWNFYCEDVSYTREQLLEKLK